MTASLMEEMHASGIAVVRPGDKLVLAYAYPMSGKDAAGYKAKLEQLMPGVEVIIAAGVHQLAVYPGDGAPNGTSVHEDGGSG